MLSWDQSRPKSADPAASHHACLGGGVRGMPEKESRDSWCGEAARESPRKNSHCRKKTEERDTHSFHIHCSTHLDFLLFPFLPLVSSSILRCLFARLRSGETRAVMRNENYTRAFAWYSSGWACPSHARQPSMQKMKPPEVNRKSQHIGNFHKMLYTVA